MSDVRERRAREDELRKVEARIARGEGTVELAFRRARLLDGLGRSDEARDGYVAVLRREPAHFGALVDLGTLLFKAGLAADARTCYAAAVAHHPENPIGHANLAFVLLKGGQPAAAREHYETALRLDPRNVEAHRGLAVALAALGEAEAAEAHRRIGFGESCVTTLPYRGEETPVRVLLLVSTTAGNVGTDRFLDDRIFAVSKLVVEYARPETPLPPHDVVFNALGDADVCAPALEAARALLRRTDAPLINPPDAVLRTGRAENAARLGALPGVITPRIEQLPRALLAGPDGVATLEARGFAFPLLLRSPGFHTGHNFEKIERAGDLAAAAAALPGDELLALEFLDARGADGKVRKYRVMLVDGRLYPLHLAIADQWKVHYFSADMAERPEHRAEDGRFLEDMERVLGPEVVAGLERIRAALGLDYGGIDFSVDRAGRILLFEANATMVIPAPKREAHWEYRRAPVDRVVEAVRAMLIERSRSSHGVA